ncbi:DUF5753 domain-containing protein [Nocardia sp. NPDC127526]|uniref:DUF5753 domain-containing protein n=1 Tax=Nocardia sp. NPDC127526 TaxID=3345393 RepID=UPI003626F21A
MQVPARRPGDGGSAALRREDYLALEDEASVIRCYAPGVVPELLQTAAYAHAVSAIGRPESTARIQHRVELLMRRQRELLDRPDPAKLWVVIEEGALRRPFGGLEAWRDQLAHLVDSVARQNITVQLMPDHAGGPAICTVPFTVLRFDDPVRGDIVHLHHAAGAQFLGDRADLDTYHAIWDRLCVHAMPPEYTGELITALTAGWAETVGPAERIHRGDH